MSTTGFQRALDHIRSISETEAQKGRLFERLMQAYFREDPLYQERFSQVWLWQEWVPHFNEEEARRAAQHPESEPPLRFDLNDTGIDLVARERDGGWCAIQCKCYAPGTRLAKKHLDSFVSASARDPFTSRIFVDTGDSWGPNALKTLRGLKPPCIVLRFGDLASRPFDWPDLVSRDPEDLRYVGKPFELRPHQREALDDVLAGLRDYDRGKLIMACGTGKTFTALRIAEAVAKTGGRVLYLVPSISLFAQSMREWATQKALPHRYVGICSDTRAGRHDEDASLLELEIPVTTDPARISAVLRETRPGFMTVVFCTYHSLPIVESAHEAGAPPFDLVLCDEAHRTTGVDRPDDRTSPFVRVHNGERIQARKRLYMTATPRIYTESSKSKAARHDVDVFSMDEEATYGPEFHRLPFSRAIERNLLSDYQVVIFTVAESGVESTLQAHLGQSRGSEINITDAAKIVGCWRALQGRRAGREEAGRADPKADRGRHTNGAPAGGETTRPLVRAIAFANTIRDSKRLEAHWDRVVEEAVAMLPEERREGALRCSTRHVDGQHNALERKGRIDWLKGREDGVCRILSNARCLSEGVDVPALDAVFFMAARKSPVEIVQAVGRVMRKSEGKKYGYIVLPVAIPPGVAPEKALNDNKRFGTVWGVLRALRSHDDRFDAEINRIDLNERKPDRIIVDGDIDPGGDDQLPFDFPPLDLSPDAIYARIVERCGDRKYWETWAKDIADIFARLVERIGRLLENPANEALLEWFEGFHEELRGSINESVTEDAAIDMIAQHILTVPVFEALFEGYDFASGNPIATALDELRRDFGEFGLENEIRDMAPFYKSVRRRARGLDNSAARQQVLKELYEHFFRVALKRQAERLGIVYTPTEVVDFILRSADHILREEFGRGLTDAGVHVLDPFTGTGIFLARLLQLGLVDEADLKRKFEGELHANEVVLLAYYIAAVNIEEAYRGRRGTDATYEPFGGIVLADTFNLNNPQTGVFLSENSERARRQEKVPIQVIVGNPPWSAWQKSSADDNPNPSYPEMEGRIAETYAARSTATLKSSLYDTYKMAIRWASDRIGEQGVVAFVTNGSWIEGNVDSGVRACLAEEFTSIHVVNLRGNQRTQGERSRREGGKVFGQGSRAPVAITVLVRHASSRHEGCRILYHDIGDYLKREEKLGIVGDAESIAGIARANQKSGWREIVPDEHHDWIGQRDAAFQDLYPIGTKEAKAGKADDVVFRLYSSGYKTSRDAYTYNFSKSSCAGNAQAMVDDYMGAMVLRERRPDYSVDDAADEHSSHVRWDASLKDNLRRGKKASYSIDRIQETQYRPYIRSCCYIDYVLANRKYQQDRIFPLAGHSNRAICVPGIGSTKGFSALVVDRMPDLHCVSFGQCFPRWRHEQQDAHQRDLLTGHQDLVRIDNIPETALRRFRVEYGDRSITGDDIFNYVYGVLQSPHYHDRFANDLVKGLPRIPFALDFHAFADAGAVLAELHLNYEDADFPEHPLEVVPSTGLPLKSSDYRLGTRPMRFADKERRDTLIVNDRVQLAGIPPEAHRYVVNGRTPLEWLNYYYKTATDKRSGIVNDANEWFSDPRDLVTTIQRLVYLSIETARIVDGLPDPLPEEVTEFAFELGDG